MKLSDSPQHSVKSFKSLAKNHNITDLYEDELLQNIYWNERALFKAMPKSAPKVRKMKS